MTTEDAARLERKEPRTEKGMVVLIGPLGTCVGIVTKAYAEEFIKERTDEQGICQFCFEEL